MLVKGLKSFQSWRTLVAGVVLGYVIAWGVHWATTLYASGVPIHHHVPGLTPIPPPVERN